MRAYPACLSKAASTWLITHRTHSPLAALRWHGYRSDNRYIVFQCLQHTLNVKSEVWRVLAQCYQRRNVAGYEGHLEASDQLVVDLIAAANLLQKKVEALAPIKPVTL